MCKCSNDHEILDQDDSRDVPPHLPSVAAALLATDRRLLPNDHEKNDHISASFDEDPNEQSQRTTTTNNPFDSVTTSRH